MNWKGASFDFRERKKMFGGHPGCFVVQKIIEFCVLKECRTATTKLDMNFYLDSDVKDSWNFYFPFPFQLQLQISFFPYFSKLPPYTQAGFDLTTRNSAGEDDTTRPHRQCTILISTYIYVNLNLKFLHRGQVNCLKLIPAADAFI
jgi:hypothetical protein